MKRITASVLAFSAFSLLGGSEIARAQDTYFPNDATINYAVPGDALIGYNSSFVPSGPTVSLVTGGSVGGNLYVANTSNVYVTGGSVAGSLQSEEFSRVAITGGSIGGNVNALADSVINIRGGSIGGDFDASGTFDSRFHFYGTNLAATLITVGHPYQDDSAYLYQLSGALQDGTLLASKNLYVYDPNQFTLVNAVAAVPEPGVLAFASCTALSVGGLLMRRRRR